jgi:hypothetical protein
VVHALGEPGRRREHPIHHGARNADITLAEGVDRARQERLRVLVVEHLVYEVDEILRVHDEQVLPCAIRSALAQDTSNSVSHFEEADCLQAVTHGARA